MLFLKNLKDLLYTFLCIFVLFTEGNYFSMYFGIVFYISRSQLFHKICSTKKCFVVVFLFISFMDFVYYILFVFIFFLVLMLQNFKFVFVFNFFFFLLLRYMCLYTVRISKKKKKETNSITIFFSFF